MSRGPVHYNCEDYLLAIEDLIATKGYARCCEIAEIFHVQNASVSGMILRLHNKGWVVRQRHRPVTLTDQGRKIARQLWIRRDLLDRFFQKMGLSPSELVQELHTLEHVLSFKASRAIRNRLKMDSAGEDNSVATSKKNGGCHG
jgi:Mn-dependent DtxR family transcriptional regulator